MTREYKLFKVLSQTKDLASGELINAIKSDIELLQDTPHEDHAKYFNVLHSNFFNLLTERKFVDYIREWEQILFRIREVNPEGFKRIHKGTPYYFCGVAAFHIKDYERAVFYFDAALIEDRNKSSNWETLPAALFLKLDSEKEEQFAKIITELVEKLAQRALLNYNDSINDSFSLEELKELFLIRSLNKSIQWRSAATALLSFILEKESRRKEFKIRSSGGGTMEPFFVHFFKGCLLFETLLKLSPEWNGDETVTLWNVLSDTNIKNMLGVDIKKHKFGRLIFEQIVDKNKEWRSMPIPSNDRVILTAYGIRNTTGHNLSWQTNLSVDDYMNLSDDILFAIFLVISKLYR